VTLTKPVTITVKYSDEDEGAAGGDPENLVLAYYDQAGAQWKTLDTTVNTTDKTLSALTSHLSTWAVLVKTTTPAQGLPLWSWTLSGIAALVLILMAGRFLMRKGRARV
jgi:hypothetical protein